MTSTNKIKVYLVGGAVRDTILGRAVKDLDFVVVGATRGYMEGMGFDQVGADFPVFLHPKTKDEFALARTERKSGEGYHGFECDFNIDVTLEDDLVRRDLTVNAMAIEVDPKILETGEMVYKNKTVNDIIDPFNGVEDARAGILRHTSEAFAEDPLRVLRTCRFAARYDFVVAPETIVLMRDIVGAGEMGALPEERVFAEFQKALMEDHPEKFFHYMNITDAYDLYFDEIAGWTNDALDFGISIGASFEERVALLCEGASPVDMARMLTNIKAPNHIIDTTMWFCHLQALVEGVSFDRDSCELTSSGKGGENTKALWEDINRVNGWRNHEKLQSVAHLCLYFGEADTFKGVRTVLTAVRAGAKVGFNDLDPKSREDLVGKEIGEAISQRRLEVIQELNLFPS